MFGAPWLLKFLSYLLCLLFGFPSTNNASLCSDPFLKLYHKNCLEVHKSLEQLGRWIVKRRLRQLVSLALENGFVGHTVVLSSDFIHSPYWGRGKLLKLLGKQWSTMMNRPFPGLLPLVGFDLLSKLPIYIGRFVGGVRRDGQENKRDQEAVYCKVILEAVRFLKSCGITTISCLIADRAFTSVDLLKELSGILRIAKKYILPLKSNSDLKKYIGDVSEWFKDGKGNLVGMVRGVDYHGIKGNLIVLRIMRKKHWKRKNKKTKHLTLLYLTNYNDDNPVDILKRYRKRGAHEGFFGRLSCMGFHQKPGNSINQIKAHFLLCISLEHLLEELRRELHLDNMDIKSFRSALERPGYVWKDKCGKLNTIMLVNRAFIRRIGRSTIELQSMRIRFIETRNNIDLGPATNNYCR
ncbi:MAG: transposase [Nitrososphaerales archaeon]